MTMAIFLLLNSMGVVFMLYVLVQFWREGRRASRGAGECRMVALYRDMPEVFIMTRPVSRISRSERDRASVIPLPVRKHGMGGMQPIR